ncbi:MAG TPA: DUF2500 domain-containing protein, partial [Candidatus Angelobacter sp.]|nr:DUF2500 domain-containing protein [Candidatus Angelobacter sp.]
MFPDVGFFGGFPSFFVISFALIFLLVIGGFIFVIVSGIRQWHSNNKQPILTVPAQIVSKRTDVSRHTHNNDGNMSHSASTSYY